MMIAGAGLAINHLHELPQNTLAAANLPVNRPVPVIVGSNSLPLDIQLDLDKKASKSRATPKDSINIIDSVRYITKVKWKTRYRRGAHITHNGTGNELAAVNPDSLSKKPANNDMLVREEKTKDSVIAPKAIPIQLTVGGKVVYSTNDIHSGVEGQ
jgi:hypothetical protein